MIVLALYVVVWIIIWRREGSKKALFMVAHFFVFLFLFLVLIKWFLTDCGISHIMTILFTVGYSAWLYGYCVKEGHLPWFFQR